MMGYGWFRKVFNLKHWRLRMTYFLLTMENFIYGSIMNIGNFG